MAKEKDAWYGIHADHVLKLSIDDQQANKKERRIKYDSFPEYLVDGKRGCLEWMMTLTTYSITFHFTHLVRSSVMRYPGLRVMRQILIQCMFSFLCARKY